MQEFANVQEDVQAETLTLDFTNTPYITARDITKILKIRRNTKNLKLVNLNDFSKEILEVTKLNTLLVIE